MPTANELTFADLIARVRAFSQVRDWEQFHDPKSLLLALMGEVGEIAELFQWREASAAAAAAHTEPLASRVADEVADVLIYLLRFIDVCGVDATGAVVAKLAINESRFPPGTGAIGHAPI